MNYRREIDGLRALAILPVILFHAGFKTFSGGFIGVDVFFVISGYLITTIILNEQKQGTFSIIEFYERRARRILPALFLVMMVCLPFAWIWLLPSDMKDFSQSLSATSLFASNILFWHESGYFDSAAELKPLLHTWSLAVEEQYYLIFPVILLKLWNPIKRWAAATLGIIFITSFAASQWAAHAQPTAAFYLLPTRMWELLIGTFTAFYLFQRSQKSFHKTISGLGEWLGLALIAYATFNYSKTTPFPGFYAIAPTLGAALIILFSSQQTIAGRLLGNKAFVGVGLISYSAYLWHQPLFAFARQRSLSEPQPIIFASLCMLTFILSYLSWRFVEKPFRDKTRFRTNPTIATLAIINLIFLTIGTIGHKTDGYKGRFDAEFFDRTPNMSVFESQVKNCWQMIERTPHASQFCTLGDQSGALSFALLGDSHAGSLLYTLDQQAKKLQLQGRNYSYRSCPPLSTAEPLSNEGSEEACHALRNHFFKTLSNDPSSIPEIIIISARWALLMNQNGYNNDEGGIEHGENWVWSIPSEDKQNQNSMRSEITNSIKKIIDSGKIVLLIYPIPEMGWDVPRILGRHLVLYNKTSDSAASVSYSSFLERNTSAIQTLDSLGNNERLIRIRPDKILCDTYVKNRCIAHLDGESLYFDTNHLSNRGAEIVMQNIFELPHFKTNKHKH